MATQFTIRLKNEPGALANLTGRLADAGINISGVVLLARHQGKVELSITVDDLDRARRVLATSTVAV